LFEKEPVMSSHITESLDRAAAGNPASGARSRLVPALLAAAMGFVLVYASAFADMPAVHDAAHDGRHSAGFPCH
jgi:cobalt transporter subunit CbtB